LFDCVLFNKIKKFAHFVLWRWWTSIIWSAPREYARSTKIPQVIRYCSESRAVPLDMPLQYERCVIQWCKGRSSLKHGQTGIPVRCNLSQSVERRKDWKSWSLVNYFVILMASRRIRMPPCASCQSGAVSKRRDHNW
jgi:hypothetical protein